MVIFLFFLIIDLYFFIPEITAQIFLPTAELGLSTETPTNRANAEIKTQPMTAKTKTRKCFQ